MDKMTELFYDAESDVLYLSIGKPRSAVSQELGDDLLLRVDPDTDEIVGFTVFNLSERFGSANMPQTLPIQIELRRSE